MNKLQEIILGSTHHMGPLAEIRTDGHILEIIQDYTGGKITKDLKGSYERLQKLIRKTSHLTVSITDDLKLQLQKFHLDTGDVIEVTQDGKTALLNGALVPDLLKGLLFDALNEGKVSAKKS